MNCCYIRLLNFTNQGSEISAKVSVLDDPQAKTKHRYTNVYKIIDVISQ